MTTFTYDESAISRVNTGIRIGVYPSSDASASIELERATAGSSSSFLRIASMSAFAGQVQASMDDRLPADGVRRFYRARSVRGDAASTYTRTVSATPATLLMNTVMTPPLSGTPIGTNIFLSSASQVVFGRPNAPKTWVGRNWFARPTDFVAASSSQRFKLSTAPGSLALCPSVAGQTITAYLPLTFPPGAVPSALDAYGIRKGAQSTCTIRVLRATSSGVKTITTITATAGANGHLGLGLAFSSVTVLDNPRGDQYLLKLTLRSSANSTHAGLYSVKWTYNVPSLNVGF